MATLFRHCRSTTKIFLENLWEFCSSSSAGCLRILFGLSSFTFCVFSERSQCIFWKIFGSFAVARLRILYGHFSGGRFRGTGHLVIRTFRGSSCIFLTQSTCCVKIYLLQLNWKRCGLVFRYIKTHK